MPSVGKVEWDWDAWASDPPYAELDDDAVIEVWRPYKGSPVSRITLRDVPKDIDIVGLWWRPANDTTCAV